MAEPPTDPDAEPSQVQAQPEPALQIPIRREDVLEISRRLAKWPTRPPSPEALMATIKRLSEERKISYLDHGNQRFETRFKDQGFDVFDMYYVLENGGIDGKIEPGKKEGEWKVKMVAVPEGMGRKMGVVPIVVREERLLIKTVEWEDR
jgi:hypothetical protein